MLCLSVKGVRILFGTYTTTLLDLVYMNKMLFMFLIFKELTGGGDKDGGSRGPEVRYPDTDLTLFEWKHDPERILLVVRICTLFVQFLFNGVKSPGHLQEFVSKNLICIVLLFLTVPLRYL